MPKFIPENKTREQLYAFAKRNKIGNVNSKTKKAELIIAVKKWQTKQKKGRTKIGSQQLKFKLIVKPMKIKPEDMKLIYLEKFNNDYYTRIPTQIPSTIKGKWAFDLRYNKLLPSNEYYEFFQQILKYKGKIKNIIYENADIHLTKSLIVSMNPETFLYYATPRTTIRGGHRIPSFNQDSLLDILNRLLKKKTIWNPSFEFKGNTNQVSQHEGRHRCFVFYHLGIPNVFVNLRLNDHVNPHKEYGLPMTDFEYEKEFHIMRRQPNTLEKMWRYQQIYATPPKYLLDRNGYIILKKQID